MAWMTTEEIKSYLNIVDTAYDASIAKYNPVAQQRLESFIGRSELVDEYILPLGYEPDFSKLVWLILNESGTASVKSNIKSQSFDGESITYGDVKITDIAKTSKEQFIKFKPLRKRYW